MGKSFGFTPLESVARALERGNSRVQILGGHEQVIGVESCDGQDTHSCRSERPNERSEHADFGQHEWPVNFDYAPAALKLKTGRNAGFFDDDGEFVGGAGNGEKRTLRGPRRKRSAFGKSDNGIRFRESGQLQVAQRKCHCLEGAPTKNQNCTSCKLSMVSRNALRVKSVRRRTGGRRRSDSEGLAWRDGGIDWLTITGPLPPGFCKCCV